MLAFPAPPTILPMVVIGVAPTGSCYLQTGSYELGTGIGMYAFICAVLAALLTALYSWLLLFMTFHGTSRAGHHALERADKSPWVMLGPLVVLALGAVFAEWALTGWFIGADWEHFWNGSIFNGSGNAVVENIAKVPFWVDTAPLVMALLGIALAYVMYIANPLLPVRLVQSFGGIYRFLPNKWYFDELYDLILVEPTMRLARLFWQVVDVTIIDGVPNGLAALTTEGSRELVKIQTGSLAVYAFVMRIGVVVLVGIFRLSR